MKVPGCVCACISCLSGHCQNCHWHIPTPTEPCAVIPLSVAPPKETVSAKDGQVLQQPPFPAPMPVPHRSYGKCLIKECKLCYPSTSSSDCIYKKELAAEILKLTDMSGNDILLRYGKDGWRYLIKRYLEATCGQ